MRVHLAAGQAVERRVRIEPLCDPREEVVGIDAVVVRECEHVCVDVRERGVACTRETSLGSERFHAEPLVLVQDPLDAVIGVLVDDEYAKRAVRLPLERRKQPFELVDAVDRRDDQIEGRHGAVR